MRGRNSLWFAVILLLFVQTSTLLARTNRGDQSSAADRNDDQTPRTTADNINDLQADDAHTQVEAAQRLGTAVLDDASRAAVLMALEPHLASDDRALRLASVAAYAHWATRTEKTRLMQVVASRSSKEAMDGSSIACAAAVVGLIRIDPQAADQAVRERMDDFFFRDHTTQTLLTFAEMEPTYSATAISLLKLIDPDDKSIKLLPGDAVAMLSSDSATSRTDAANALKISPVSAGDRPAVLRALSTHLQSTDGRTRLPFVRAFVHWTDEKSIDDLQKIVAFPDPVGRMSGQEDCWSAAIAGMVRLNAGQAAVDAYNSRVDDRQMNFSLQRSLEPLARGTGKGQPLASDLLQQLREPRATRLKLSTPSNPIDLPGNRV